jgi:hypothetical protein
MPHPCIGSRVRVFRTRRSRVPRRTSDSEDRKAVLLDFDRKCGWLLSECKRSGGQDVVSLAREERLEEERLEEGRIEEQRFDE